MIEIAGQCRSAWRAGSKPFTAGRLGDSDGRREPAALVVRKTQNFVRGHGGHDIEPRVLPGLARIHQDHGFVVDLKIEGLVLLGPGETAQVEHKG